MMLSVLYCNFTNFIFEYLFFYSIIILLCDPYVFNTNY